MAQNAFLEALNSGRVLVADGATGSNLQARGLAQGMASEQWIIENPAAVMQLHRDFILAGSDLILTSTFGGTSLRLEHCGLQDRTAEVNRRAAELARQAVNGKVVLVGGSMGPTGHLFEPLGPLSRAAAVAAYAVQAQGLAEGGADVLVIETMFDMAEATAAIEGARARTSLPIVCCFSYDMGAATMMGLRPAQVAQELTALGVDVIGVNCGKSLVDNLTALQAVRAATDKPIWMKPNAGLPRMGADDKAVYDVTPEEMGAQARLWVQAGARVIGGCCGTTPERLREIAKAAR